jgi:sarcosine oxidase
VFICGDASEQVYGFPAIDGPAGGVKVSFFRAGEPTTPETVDRVVRPAEVAALRRRAAEVFPGLTGPAVAATVCLYTTTPDEHFVIGPHPAHENVVVACGFSGHGFKFVPVVGEILADLALDGRTDHPIGLFDPGRFRSH